MKKSKIKEKYLFLALFSSVLTYKSQGLVVVGGDVEDYVFDFTVEYAAQVVYFQRTYASVMLYSVYRCGADIVLLYKHVR